MGLLGIMKQKNVVVPKLPMVKPLQLPDSEPIKPPGLMMKKPMASSTEIKPMPGLMKRLTGK
jgi:hypothetical protein